MLGAPFIAWRGTSYFLMYVMLDITGVGTLTYG